MDKNEFRQRLEQVAVLKDIKPTRTANPRIEYITETDEDGEEYQVPVEIRDNPTLGFELVKLKDQHAICQLGCGEIVTNQIIERRLATTPKKHWRTRCKNCDCYVGPDGQSFIKGSHAVQLVFLKHHNQELGRSKPRKSIETPEGPARITETDHYTETTTNNTVIRRYK